MIISIHIKHPDISEELNFLQIELEHEGTWYKIYVPGISGMNPSTQDFQESVLSFCFDHSNALFLSSTPQNIVS